MGERRKERKGGWDAGYERRQEERRREEEEGREVKEERGDKGAMR